MKDAGVLGHDFFGGKRLLEVGRRDAIYKKGWNGDVGRRCDRGVLGGTGGF